MIENRVVASYRVLRGWLENPGSNASPWGGDSPGRHGSQRAFKFPPDPPAGGNGARQTGYARMDTDGRLWFELEIDGWTIRVMPDGCLDHNDTPANDRVDEFLARRGLRQKA